MAVLAKIPELTKVQAVMTDVVDVFVLTCMAPVYFSSIWASRRHTLYTLHAFLCVCFACFHSSVVVSLTQLMHSICLAWRWLT